MRVLVNALPLRYGGGVTYLQHQLEALARVSPHLSLHTLLSPWGEFDDLPGTTEVVPVRSVPTRFAFEQLRLPLRSSDVLYCPASFGPVLSRSPVVLTLHNANYYGEGLKMQEASGSRPWWKVRANYAAMRRADAIVSISQSLADQVTESLPRVQPKMHVIHSGAPEWPDESIPVQGLPERYILSVGSAAPHKRLEDVVRGWASSAEIASAPLSLVIVGRISAAQQARHAAAAGSHADHLVHLGSVRDRRSLKWIYEQASAFVSMSVLEAFPLTPGEAGAVGCPLVLSDIPAHREVTLNNATFVRPRDPAALAQTLADGAGGWEPRSQPWKWPTTWDDNARELSALFGVTPN